MLANASLDVLCSNRGSRFALSAGDPGLSTGPLPPPPVFVPASVSSGASESSAASEASAVGPPVDRDNPLAWLGKLRAADFDMARLNWQPNDFLACCNSLWGAAAEFERVHDFIAAGALYSALPSVARHATLHVFEESSMQHLLCTRLRALAHLGVERCTQALHSAAQTAAAEIAAAQTGALPPAAPGQVPAVNPGLKAADGTHLSPDMPEAVRTLVKREIVRLQGNPGGSETEMARRYVDWCLALPWNRPHPGAIDVQEARRILDAEHQGLDKVKERILEEIAVQKRLGAPTGKVLCLVGPSGVGKTSVVRSIAHALGKTLLYQALGGVSDEMEIRGNNRAYTGAQPGRIVQAMCGAGYSDPVFLLDEIDKIVRQTHRGDPSAALLELLDPEQNHAFKDAYLGFGYDLSQVTFIATANYLDDIPVALRDRLEIITLGGYTPLEKHDIGRKHLIAKQMKKNKLDESHLTISDAALTHIIKHYTQEAGVRELEKQIAAVCRKVVTRLESGELTEPVALTPDNVARWLGPQRYRGTTRMQEKHPGVVNGLAWTQVGGVMLPVECKVHAGLAHDKGGHLVLTGNVRKVMEESSSIALNFLRTTYPAISESLKTRDLYLHLPAGAVEKDGPSAGVTLVTAMTAALTQRAVPDDTAMTGEVGLFGEIWPVGGIKEKSLAAYGAGCKRLFLPKANEVDLEDVPDEVKNNLDIIFVDHCADLLCQVFGSTTALELTPPLA